MTLIQHELEANLGRYAVTEGDCIILGDFNDNPHAINEKGQPAYSPALYEHMKFKGYIDLVTADMKTTRLSSNLDSLIDHILISGEAQEHVPQVKAVLLGPEIGTGDALKLTSWRQTFSDHLPLSFKIDIAASDDDSDFFDD
jgi:endonuclease/exonuclease/phosphatase family metal-dependent hydrolase